MRGLPCAVVKTRETLIYSVWLCYFPKADGSREHREPWSEGGGFGWLCRPHIFTKPERIKETALDGRAHSCFKKSSCLAKQNN